MKQIPSKAAAHKSAARKSAPHAPARSHASNRSGKGSNSLRIIGGEWRGRKLVFPDIEGLRPTPDRVRETLFNWLQNWVAGATCLDLFSGSGALGLEALSRGARHATLVDNHKKVTDQLQSNLVTLAAANADVLCCNAVTWLQNPTPEQHYDLIFLDPPFRQDILKDCSELLEKSGIMAPTCLIYIEAEKQLQPLPVPQHWQCLKQKTAGQVSSYLYRRSPPE